MSVGPIDRAARRIVVLSTVDATNEELGIVAFIPKPEPREGILMVYDHEGTYVGCIGSETWKELVERELARRGLTLGGP